MTSMGILLLFSLLGAETAEEAEITLLGQPCRARQILAGRVVRDRASDRELLVLTGANEAAHVELIFVDFAENTARAYTAPAGSGSWALREVPDDRLCIGTYYDGHFMLFDLKKMTFTQAVDFPGESYIWNLAMGSDGRIYGGTYNGAKLGAFDLETYEVEDCGAPAPPNLYLRHVSALPDGRIYCNFGMNDPEQLIYDPEKKTFSPVPEALQGQAAGVTWKGFFLAGSGVYRGSSLETVTPPPFPAPPAEKGGWSADTYLTTAETLFLRQGNARYRYRAGEEKLTLLFDMDLRGGRCLAAAADGSVLGVRGQEYFRIQPGDTALELKRIPGEASARPSLFLKVDPEGRLWGGPHFGQTIFMLDPATGKYENTGAVCDGGGEVYEVTFLNGKVYTASYAGGDIMEYDPDKPWDQWNGTNPKPIARLSSRGYIRPVAGIMTGGDGLLYSGWNARYSVYGGAIAITDPGSGESELIENPLGEQEICGLAVDEKYIYAGSSLNANGLPEKEGESPAFGVLDKATKKVVFRHVFEGATHVNRFACGEDLVFFTAGGKIHRYDKAAEAILFPGDGGPAVTSYDVSDAVAGVVFYGDGTKLMRYGLKSGQAVAAAELPGRIHTVAAAGAGAVYVVSEADVYRVRW
jgi:outer membrane protein assembly factor BamB